MLFLVRVVLYRACLFGGKCEGVSSQNPTKLGELCDVIARKPIEDKEIQGSYLGGIYEVLPYDHGRCVRGGAGKCQS